MIAYSCVCTHSWVQEQKRGPIPFGTIMRSLLSGIGESRQLFPTNMNAVNEGGKAGGYCGQSLLHRLSIRAIKHLEKDSLPFVQDKDRAQVL